MGVAGADWDGGDAGGARELGFGGEALGAGDLAQQLAGRQGPKAVAPQAGRDKR
jgi:hypothetical protein